MASTSISRAAIFISPWPSRARSRRSTSGRGAAGSIESEDLMTAPIVLITGASRGIGAATARLAAKRGFDVAISYLKDRASAEAVVAEVAAAGRRAVAVQADMGLEDDIVRMFATVDAQLGRITHLVCNTGITGPASRIETLTTKDAEEILTVNVLGRFGGGAPASPPSPPGQAGRGGPMGSRPPAMAPPGAPAETWWSLARK